MHQRPIPSPASLENTKAKASIDFPHAADVNPLSVLNLDYVLALDEEGFIDHVSAGQ
jgi:hypothetical protein